MTSTRGSSVNSLMSNSAAAVCRFSAGAVEDHAVAVDDAEDAVIARLERIEPQRVGLGDVAGGVDLVVQDHEHALAARRRFGRDAEPLEQVGRSFIAERARIAHRADDDNGFSERTVRLRKYAVSSSVSVPLVTTMPASS